MVKIFVRLLWKMVRVLIWLEQLLWRCVHLHRVRIVQVVHPLSASLMLLTVGFFVTYEMFYILPECCDVSGIHYKLHWLLILFYTHNIVGNMCKCWLTDTSFVGLPPDRWNPLPAEAPLWHLCTFCQMLVPPRAWHCRLCNCCILKRDHHCNVVANCIGHANQRYFVGLLLHLTLGSCTALVYNVYHMFIQRSRLSDPIEFVGISLGLGHTDRVYKLFKGQTLSPQITWLIITGGILKLNIFATVLATTHLVMQLVMVCRGSSLYYVKDRTYDFGLWNNLRNVLGRRMLWTAFSPFVSSPLPHDGAQWQMPSELSDRKPV